MEEQSVYRSMPIGEPKKKPNPPSVRVTHQCTRAPKRKPDAEGGIVEKAKWDHPII